MGPLAASIIAQWNHKGRSTGLITVSFDQRNHGTRLISPLANEAWRSGNPKHAQDMFSIYHGTSVDLSHLLTYLSSYIFPTDSHLITTNIVLGISLGGHAAWHCLLHEPRVQAAISVIGCPDYLRLMEDRARLSKLETQGAGFVGSKDFPPGLVKAVEEFDPAGLFLGVQGRDETLYVRRPTESEKQRLMPLMETCLKGKRLLNIAGGADKLVPYKCGEPFLRWLKDAIGSNGWFKNGNLVLEDIVFDGVGHEMSPEMVSEVHGFIFKTLDQASSKNIKRASKM